MKITDYEVFFCIASLKGACDPVLWKSHHYEWVHLLFDEGKKKSLMKCIVIYSNDQISENRV